MNRQLVAQVLARIDMAPQWVTRGRQNAFVSGLMEMTSLSTIPQERQREMQSQMRQEMLLGYGYDSPVQPMDKPYAFSNGVAIIPVHGSLLNRFGGSWGFATGYNAIRAQRNAAMDDPDVTLIVYDHNSYGGEAAGCLELANEIAEDRGVKPQIAVVDSNCCSASYALAAPCDKIYLTPSGQVGSIGVCSMHINLQKALEQDGVEITLITSGSHKADGNSFEALPDDVRADIQADNDASWDKFITLVADGRPMSAEEVRDTQAQVYRADEALSLKLIDGIKTPTDAVSSFLAELADPEPGGDLLPPATEDDPEMAATPEELATARNEGMAAERQRSASIMNCDAAKKRPKLAKYFATKTAMSAEDAEGALKEAPEETEETPAPTTGTGEGDGKDGKGGDKSQGQGQQQQQTRNPLSTTMDQLGGAGVEDEPNAGGDGKGGKGDDPMAKPGARADRALKAIGLRKGK